MMRRMRGGCWEYKAEEEKEEEEEDEDDEEEEDEEEGEHEDLHFSLPASASQLTTNKRPTSSSHSQQIRT